MIPSALAPRPVVPESEGKVEELNIATSEEDAKASCKLHYYPDGRNSSYFHWCDLTESPPSYRTKLYENSDSCSGTSDDLYGVHAKRGATRTSSAGGDTLMSLTPQGLNMGSRAPQRSDGPWPSPDRVQSARPAPAISAC